MIKTGYRRLSFNAFVVASSFFFSYAFGAEGLSTSFTDVQIKGVAQGKPFIVRSSLGEGIRIQNLGKNVIRIHVDVLRPGSSDLRGGAWPIPDIHWLKINPNSVDIPGQSDGQSGIVLTVPNDPAYRGKTFQATIWSHSVPLDGHSMEIGAGLLSRLRFTVNE